MDRAFRDGPAFLKDAKEYTRFCRLRRLFLVDGLEAWRKALEARGLPEGEIKVKLAAAAELVRQLGEPSSDRKGA